MKIEDIQLYIKQNPAVLIYFYNDSCAPCKILRPKVQDVIASDFPKMNFLLVDAMHYPATAAYYGVFASPTLLVFFEEKEYLRESKNISINELREKIQRLYSMIF